jgi:hypothetical protein
VRFSEVVLMPLADWSGEWQSFTPHPTDAIYLSNDALAQNESVAFDKTGLYQTIEQTTSDGSTPERNVYGVATRGGPGIKPNYPAWLVAIPERGNATGTDRLEQVVGDTLTATVVVQPRHVGVAAG